VGDVVDIPDKPGPGPRRSGGFTLVELMIVLAIIAIMSALAVPSFNRDNLARESRDAASDLARELQKCRVEAVTTRLGIRAFVFSDRVELRPFLGGTTPGAAPVAPALTDPLLRAVPMPGSVAIAGMVAQGATAPSLGSVSPTVHADLDFTNQGSAQLVGQPVPTGASILLQSLSLPSNAPDFDYRVDLTALTAFVSVRTN
jgi:prepilin-type N-terminal cleavage/methylation domain-containing protein